MKNNQEIIQEIYRVRENMHKFDFCPSQKMTDFRLLSSALDVYGVVILKDNKVYRGIYPKSKEKFIELYNTGILQTLMQEGLIPKFEVSDFYTDEYPVMIEVEKLNIIHARDYTYSMIREEAKLKLRLLEILSEFGYTLIDGHTANATFKNGRAVFFDLGSFIKSPRTGNADSEIWLYDIIPLIFLTCGKIMSGRGIYYGLPNPWLIPYVALKDSKEVKDTIAEFFKLVPVDEKIKEKINEFKPLESTELDILFPSENYAINIKQKEDYLYLKNFENKCDDVCTKIVEKICKSSSASNIIHLGCSTGYFVNKCVQSCHFKSVLGLDCNEFLLEYAVNHVKGANFLFCNAVIGGPTLPINADVVYTSEMVYYLLFTKKFDITFVLTQIKRFVHKFLYIEFFPYGRNKEQRENIPEHYTVDWFEQKLSKFFKIISKETLDTVEFEGEQKPYRILYETEILS